MKERGVEPRGAPMDNVAALRGVLRLSAAAREEEEEEEATERLRRWCCLHTSQRRTTWRPRDTVEVLILSWSRVRLV